MLTRLFIGFLAFLTVGLCAASIRWLWKQNCANRAGLFLSAGVAGTALLFILLAGQWLFLSYYLKYAAVFFYLLAVLKSHYRLKRRSIFSRVKRDGKSGPIKAALLFLFIFLCAVAIKGRYYTGEPVELSFPLKNGRYYVMQGGSGFLLNAFHGFKSSQRYAVDLVKLNLYGNRANGLFPKKLSSYAIFGDTVYSPCDGMVVRSSDGAPDDPRDKGNYKDNPAGNHVIINCKGVYVLIAHMMGNSLHAGKGDNVKAGEPLGNVGNSGNSMEPHLHIQATKELIPGGEGVPILFNGYFPVMNGIITARE
ncbi:MAG: M23 family metallopeptidase [Deltaproteobacteria bacterium]|nr:M23 family metallopeptidase [Deltaproteobacteria bacterium]MBI5902000.1 M23 family metallopeptidase [Deltaproteobacteria bacterium]